MNKEIKEIWVKALRSGKYTQCKGALRKDFSDQKYFCCLGVLCDLHRKLVLKTSDKVWIKRKNANKEDKTYVRHMHVEFLPASVADWAGIPLNGGPTTRVPLEHGNDLAHHNDNGVTFNEIADIIEKEL